MEFILLNINLNDHLKSTFSVSCIVLFYFTLGCELSLCQEDMDNSCAVSILSIICVERPQLLVLADAEASLQVQDSIAMRTVASSLFGNPSNLGMLAVVILKG